MDRLILISTNPNRLHIYDTAKSAIVSVPLTQPPLSLSISPDGLRAAVGHDGLVSYVDLEKTAVLQVFDVPTVAAGIIASSSWIYTIGSYQANPYSINIETREAVKNTAAFSVTGGRLNVGINAIYGTRDGTSPNDVEKWNISTGPVTAETDSPYHGDYCIYGPVWFSPDWTRIYTGCGTIFRASTNPELDMYYVSSIPGANHVASLAESGALQKIALIRGKTNYYYGDEIDEAIVQLFDSPYLVSAGQFTLSGFEVGGRTYAPHGRAVFFSSDSTQLIVVKQADATSGILNDYAVERISLSASGACGARFASSSADVPAEGGTGSVMIDAPAGCVYQPASLASWITIVSGAVGSGSGTVRWAVTANLDSVARTGTIILPGQVFTITQPAQSPSVSRLYIPGYYAVDAAYAKPIDRLVLLSASPNQLHIVDPIASRDTVVALNALPLSLSVRPDGSQAAVGHDGWVTLVDLNTASVLKVFSVPTDVHSLVLAGNGYAYLFPLQEWGDLFSLELGTGRISRTSAIYNGRVPRLHVNGKSIYVGGQWQSKWDISGGVATRVTSWPSSGGCGKPWLTEDGRRLFGECAKAYTTSDVPAQDYQDNGALSNATGLVWLDESAKTATTAAIPSAGPWYDTFAKPIDDTQVQLYSDAFLEYLGSIPLPPFVVGNTNFPAHGRYVFWNQSGTGLYVIVQADSTALLTGGTAIVQLSVSDAMQVSVKSVTNGASQIQGRIAPGQAISIFGTGMGSKAGVSFTLDRLTDKVKTNLAGTEVYINGVAAPVLYASDTQVNVLVPFEVQGTGQVILQVGYQGILSPGVKITMAAAAPGIFTMNGSGSGQAVALNLDGTVCDAAHPASPGSYIMVYFTGGGLTRPGGSTGAVADTTTLKYLEQKALATVADVPATVSFSGASPALLEGINQLNIRLDEKTPAGPAQPLILTIGNFSSPAAATIAVK